MKCPCQYGNSGYCTQGRHHRCAHRLQPEWYATRGPVGPCTFRAGDCRWRCACTCHTVRRFVQPALFDLEVAG